MKLKVPIEKKIMPEGESYISAPCGCGPEGGCGCEIDTFNACLDEVNQCEVCFDEEKLAIELIKAEARYYGMHFSERMMTCDLFRAKAIIAAMPSIITIKKGSQ